MIFQIFTFILLINGYISPPLRPTKTEEMLPFTNIHYNEYLTQVLKELESDPEFSKKVKEYQDKNMTDHISKSLTFVNHKVRSKLNELKRIEINRLNELELLLEKKRNGENIDSSNTKLQRVLDTFDKEHLDHKNVHTFEIDDLQKLIKKTEKLLTNIDTAEEENYKEHELKKEYLKQQKLKNAKSDEERQKIQKEFQESEKRHKNHPKVNVPGSKKQLEEVWENEDHMEGNKFDPKAFFSLHDLNSDGHLDINEIEALMKNELEKVYDPNDSDDDMQEKYHENMRMRQNFMKMIDKDGDNVVSRKEFYEYANMPDFEKDNNEDWKTYEELADKPYTQEEYDNFLNSYDAIGDKLEDDEFSDQDETLRHIPRHQEIVTDPVPSPSSDHAQVVSEPNHIPKS